MDFQGGTLAGSGAKTSTGAVSVSNGARVAPGIALGATGAISQTSTFSNYTQAANGEYVVDINGTNDNDRYNVGNVANLNGTLTVNTNFGPNVGDTFVIMTYTTRNGAFATLNQTNPAVTYNVVYDDGLGEVRLVVQQPSGVCGDQNNDGQVNVFDAIIDLQIIVGLITPTDAQQRLSDVVRDGQINIFDVILTLQHIVGLTSITECGPLN